MSSISTLEAPAEAPFPQAFSEVSPRDVPRRNDTFVATRVALVAESREGAAGLRNLLRGCDQLLCAGVWSRGRKGLGSMKKCAWEVALVDAAPIPASEVERLVARIKADHPCAQVIVMIPAQQSDKILTAFRAGATGHVPPSATAEQVGKAIRVVAGGGSPMSLATARRLVEAVQRGACHPKGGDALSGRQKEIMERICDGMENKEIARHLSVSPETVRIHLKDIFKRMGVRNRTAAAVKYLGYAA